jgi:hypothetical protein
MGKYQKFTNVIMSDNEYHASWEYRLQTAVDSIGLTNGTGLDNDKAKGLIFRLAHIDQSQLETLYTQVENKIRNMTDKSSTQFAYWVKVKRTINYVRYEM